MKAYIGVTDNDWFSFLAQQPGIDEVNFWQPGGSRDFRTLQPGEPFLFKLHSPQHYIAGGGFFAHSTILPISLAWEAFGIKNGASSFSDMKRLVERRRGTHSHEDYKIGCIVLTQPFFFQPKDWIPVPSDFSLNIVQGKTYRLEQGEGRALWDRVKEVLAAQKPLYEERNGTAELPINRYGEPTLISPRLGQGAFRVLVTDVYERRCAVTREKTLPALEAAHIKPFRLNGPHSVCNGLLLRSDIHRLFDSGYVTITPDHRFEVSRRLKEDFDNGEQYRVFHGKNIWVPSSSLFKPSTEFLNWHNDQVYKGG